MIPTHELSYLDSISQKDILTGWSCGDSNNPNSCGYDGLTLGCTWRTLQWNTEKWDEFIPAIWTLFNYGNKPVEDFYITLQMDWDIPYADYENNAVKYYPEVRGSRIYNLNTDLSGGIIFLNDDPKNMRATSWDDDIWLSGNPMEYEWFWTNIVSSYELSTRIQPDDYLVFCTFGPISLNPGEKYDFVWAFVFGEDEADWLKNAETLQVFGQDPYYLMPPAPPSIELSSQNNKVKIRWTRNRVEVTEGEFDYSSESSIDPIRQEPDWDGYRIYRNMTGIGTIEDGGWHFVTELNSTYIYETWGTIPSDELNPEFWKRTYWAEFTDKGPGLYTGFKYFYSVVAYDISNSKSSPEENAKSIIVSGNNKVPTNSVLVIPNPYKVFNHPAFSEGVIFTNLPPICTIKIYTLNGELVKKIKHENQSGNERWDLNNDNGKKIASGIYLYTIESSQGIQKGKIAIIK
ncbi:T9SS type A sorting domain-containing protein [Candidatus Dependentiae bacterium]|nr:T9SS type A sorting domain-containing protein [Candidatus Dependentiae bacterium]